MKVAVVGYPERRQVLARQPAHAVARGGRPRAPRRHARPQGARHRLERPPLHADRHRRRRPRRRGPARRLDPGPGARGARRRRRSRCSWSTRAPGCGPATQEIARHPARRRAAGRGRRQQDRRAERPAARRTTSTGSASASRSPVSAAQGLGTGDLLDRARRAAAATATRRRGGRGHRPPRGDRPPQRRQVLARQRLPRPRAGDRLRGRRHDPRRDRHADRGRRPPACCSSTPPASAAPPRSRESVEYYTQLRSQRAAERADVALVVCDAQDGVTAAGPADRRAGDEVRLRDRARAQQVGPDRRRRRPARPGRRHRRRGARPRARAGEPQAAPAPARAHRLGDDRPQRPAAAAARRWRSPTAPRTAIPTPELNRFLADVVAARQPPAKQGHRLKMLYMAQIGDAPAALRDPGQRRTARHARLRLLRREPAARALRARGRPAGHRLRRAQAAAAALSRIAVAD